MYCQKCGNEISENAKFCPKCGEIVKNNNTSIENNMNNDKKTLTSNESIFER